MTQIDLSTVSQPTLLIFEGICRNNIRYMKQKTDASESIFSPHFKTHQSETVGKWFQEEGIDHITVSSFSMAKKFAPIGWKNILVAFPLNVREIGTLKELAEDHSIGIFINSVETLSHLEGISFSNLPEVWIEIDSGQHRSGIPTENLEQIQELAEAILSKGNLKLKGFYSHPGHTYQCRGANEIVALHNSVKDSLLDLKGRLKGIFTAEIAMGDTPGCSSAKDFNGIDKVTCGNFVYYDLTQVQIGSCSSSEIAVSVACPVVDKIRDRNQLIIYGGGVHFSKDRMTENGKDLFGKQAILDSDGKPALGGGKLVSISQEHGVLELPATEMTNYQIGDVVMVYPIHSCMAADLLGEKNVLIA